MPTIITHNFTNVHISRVGIGNATNKTITVACNPSIKNKKNFPKFDSSTGNATLKANESIIIPVDGLDVAEASIFTIIVVEPTEMEIHLFNFIYSKFSDATASINTANLNNSNIINYPEDDHFANHVKSLVLENKGAYVAKFRIHYYNAVTKKWDSKESGKFAIGKSKCWDCITELKLPNNSIVYPEVVVVWGKNKKCDSKYYYVRQDSTKVVNYTCKGTTLKPTISET